MPISTDRQDRINYARDILAQTNRPKWPNPGETESPLDVEDVIEAFQLGHRIGRRREDHIGSLIIATVILIGIVLGAWIS